MLARIYEHHVILKNPSQDNLLRLRALIHEHTEPIMLILGDLHDRRDKHIGFRLSTKIPPLEFDPSTMIPLPSGLEVTWKIDGIKRNFLHFLF